MVSHFVSDFLLQSREMSTLKSNDSNMLGQHINIQNLVVLLVVAIPFCNHYDSKLVGFLMASIFSSANAVIHGVIDWNIWRFYKKQSDRSILKNRKYVIIARRLAMMLGRPFDDEYKKQIESATKNFKYWEDQLFYNIIGLDHLLHGLTFIVLLHFFWR